MLAAIAALQDDPSTKVIALVSKPPAPEVTQAIVAQLASGHKPAVVCLLGGDAQAMHAAPNVMPARTLQECALLAVQAAGFEFRSIADLLSAETAQLAEKARGLKTTLAPEQKYVRGLFSGGTLCYEAQVIWRDMRGLSVESNAPLPGGHRMPDPLKSCGHTAVDMGEEEFTSGRPHPMIDNTLRVRRLSQEARDPEVAVILLDVVLGYGAHPDPAAELGPAIRLAREAAGSAGRSLHIVASVTGTDHDPQGLQHTVSALEQAGAIVCDSNAAAARLAGLLVQK
jgi:FdrA protein